MKAEVRFYTRPDCRLCDSAHDVVQSTLARLAMDFTVFNVEDDPDLERRYGHDVPVIEVESPHETRTFRHRLDRDEFEQEIRRLWNM
jgi:hypothetical protein